MISELYGKRIAVFDCEIKKPIEECTHGWKSLDEMGVSCLVIFDYVSMRYRVFDDHNIAEGIAILNSYEIVSGFNTVGFDWKLLKATYPTLTLEDDQRHSSDYDILREIWLSLNLNPDRFDPKTHGGYKLDDVAFETIAMRKTLSGDQAPILYQAGRIAEVIDYCIEDVRIEKTLFEFAYEYSHVIRHGEILRLGRAQFDRLKIGD